MAISRLTGTSPIRFFLAGILLLAAAVYGLYLWYLGLTPVKKTPEDKRVTYIIVCILILIVVYMVIGWLLAMILYPAFGLTYMNYGRGI